MTSQLGQTVTLREAMHDEHIELILDWKLSICWHFKLQLEVIVIVVFCQRWFVLLTLKLLVKV